MTYMEDMLLSVPKDNITISDAMQVKFHLAGFKMEASCADKMYQINSIYQLCLIFKTVKHEPLTGEEWVVL